MRAIKSLILLAAALLLNAGAVSAQGLLNELTRQAKNAVRREAYEVRRDARNAVSNAARNAVNNARNGAQSNNNQNAQPQQYVEHAHDGARETWTCPTCGKTDNEGSFCANCGTNRPAGDAGNKKEAADTTFVERSFVPGSRVIFEDTLEGERVDASPTKWELVMASDDEYYVTRRAGAMAIYLTGWHSDFKPDIAGDKYLTDSFTIEMDVWAESRVHNARTHQLIMEFATEEVLEEFSVAFCYGSDQNGPGIVSVHYWPLGTTNDVTEEVEERVREKLKPGAWNQAAVSFDHGTLTVFVNGVSVCEVKNQPRPQYVKLQSNAADSEGHTFKNFRIATN